MLKSTRARLLAMALVASAPLTAVAGDRVVLRGAGEYDNGIVPARVHVDMRQLPRPKAWRPGMPIKEIPQRKGLPKDYTPPATAVQPAGGDPLRAYGGRFPSRQGGLAFESATVNRDGVGFTGVNPPDTVGDVGNDYFIQMVNGGGGVGGTQVLVLDKSDGTQVAAFALRELAVGSNTACTTGRGDPIVMFDSTVDNGPGQPPGRWFLSEFTSASFCIYISATANPMDGTWNIYEFVSDSGGLPDYPKFAVWPDAYYIGANEDRSTTGKTVYALDRENMLAGQPTRPTQVFEIPLLAGFVFQMAQPADWDGAVPPPPGAPGLFLRHRDDEVHNAGSADETQDFLEIWEFSVDWDDSAKSTFSGPTNIGVAEFESDLCGLTSFACVPQPGQNTQLLDPLREPVMWRAQYLNFGTHQVIVGSWVTDVVGGAADIHGVRWAELRDLGGGWTLHQQGTVSPDDVNRWMPSIAMDGSGNIGVGYNVSDADTVFPGLRYTGRLFADPLDTMPIAEVSLIEGDAANASNRYGDYSSMNVDPVDECTFWFTGEYNPASQWSTRIGKFRFETCGLLVLDGQPRKLEACTASGDVPLDDIVLTLGSQQGFSNEVSLAFNPPLPLTFLGGISPPNVLPGDPPTQAVAAITVLDGALPGQYPVTVTGTADGVETQAVAFSISVADTLPAGPVLQAPGDAAVAVSPEPIFQWAAVDQAAAYLFELATDADFGNPIVSETLSTTSYQAPFSLDSQTEYFWRVSAANQCGSGTQVTASFTTRLKAGECSIGRRESVYFVDDMESGENDWVHVAADQPDTWALQTVESNSPQTAWKADSVTQTSDQQLISPLISLPAGVSLPTLQYFSRRDLEAGGAGCYDAAILEYTDNGGQTWIQVADEELQTNPYTGTVDSGYGSPLAGLQAWCGLQEWTRTVVDLRGLEGRDLQFRFRLGTDQGVAIDGWLIDDVTVQSCEPEFIFSDGFEN